MCNSTIKNDNIILEKRDNYESRKNRKFYFRLIYMYQQISQKKVMAYGKYDKFQPYEGSVRLDKALTENRIDHKYFVLEHSGHGLQNDTKVYIKYMETIEEYLNKYMADN